MGLRDGQRPAPGTARCRARRGPGAGVRCALALALVLGSFQAHADFAYGTGVELEYNSNPAREPEELDPRSDLLRRAFVEVGYMQDSRHLTADVHARQVYEDYREDVIADDARTTLDAALDWHVEPNRFTWVVRERFQQLREDALEAATPENRQDTNAFLTGPDIRWPLTRADYFLISARVGDYWFEETDDDNARAAVTVGLARRMSPVTEIGAAVRVEEADYEVVDSTQTDFTRRSAFTTARRQIRGGELAIELGYEDVDREGLEDLSGPLLRLSAVRDMRGTDQLGIEIRSGSVALGDSLSRPDQSPLELDVGTESAVTGDVGSEDAIETYYIGESGRYNISFDGAVVSEEYPEASIDRDVARMTAIVEYATSARQRLFLRLTGIREEFTEIERTDRLSVGAAGLTRELSPRLSLRTSVTTRIHDSDDPALDYEEDTLMLSIRYGRGTLE